MITANIREAVDDQQPYPHIGGSCELGIILDTLWITGRNWAEGLIDMDGLGHEAPWSVLYVQHTEQHCGYCVPRLQTGDPWIYIYPSCSLLPAYLYT